MAVCTGCSTIQKFKCNRLDWASLGHEDGRSGLAGAEAFDARAGSCLEIGATVDENAYLAGYGEGLAEYCTPESGRETALSGGAYEGVCPPADESEFLLGYNEGLESYCTQNSGYAAGTDAKEYLEICPLEIQQEFLHGYIAGLDAAVPGLDSRISALTVEVAQLESQLRGIDSRRSSYQNLRADAKEKGSEALVDFYEESLSALNTERMSVQGDLQRSSQTLSGLREKRADIDEWSRKWRASLL